MTIRNSIGLAAGLVVGALALAAPASAAWWGNGGGYYYDNRWNKQRPLLRLLLPLAAGRLFDAVQLRLLSAAGVLQPVSRTGLLDPDPAVRRHRGSGGQRCPPFFLARAGARERMAFAEEAMNRRRLLAGTGALVGVG